MTRYVLNKYSRNRRLPRRLTVLFVILGLLLLAGVIGVRREYFQNLRAVSSDTTTQYVTVASGSTVKQIALQLESVGVVRNAQALEWYVSSHNYRDKLQAGTYKLSKSETVQQIVDKLVNGKVAADLVTILPSKRIDEIRQAFISAGFKPEAVDAALKVDRYRISYPALADNPSSASLEGFLYPESFQKTASTDPALIISASLDEMQKHLTTDIRNGFAAQGLSVYEGVTLASIVEKEVSKQSDRNQVAQVFLKRRKTDMPLGSDVTARYGAIRAGSTPSLTYDSAYNTLLHKGLPPGPINNVSDSSLKAVAHPAGSDWLYFVTGDDGTTYFSNTLQEHKAFTERYCHKLCGN